MKSCFRVLFAPLALAVAMSFGGCAQHENQAPVAQMEFLNKSCPISGEEIDAKSPTVDYMGGKVAFCCDKCVAKWDKMDEAARKAALDEHKK